MLLYVGDFVGCNFDKGKMGKIYSIMIQPVVCGNDLENVYPSFLHCDFLLENLGEAHPWLCCPSPQNRINKTLGNYIVGQRWPNQKADWCY